MSGSDRFFQQNFPAMLGCVLIALYVAYFLFPDFWVWVIAGQDSMHRMVDVGTLWVFGPLLVLLFAFTRLVRLFGSQEARARWETRVYLLVGLSMLTLVLWETLSHSGLEGLDAWTAFLGFLPTLLIASAALGLAFGSPTTPSADTVS